MVPTTDPKDCQEQCKTPPKRNTDVSWGQAWGYKWVFLLICLVRAPCLTLALCWKLLWVFLFVSFLSGTSKGYLESPSCVCVWPVAVKREQSDRGMFSASSSVHTL